MEGRATVGAAFYAFSPSSVVVVFIILGAAYADAMSLQHMSGEKSTRRKRRRGGEKEAQEMGVRSKISIRRRRFSIPPHDEGTKEYYFFHTLRGEGIGKLRLSSLQIDTQILLESNHLSKSEECPLTRQEALLSHPASPCAWREPRPVSSSVTKGSPREGRLPDLEHRAKERTRTNDGWGKEGNWLWVGQPPKKKQVFLGSPHPPLCISS